MTFKRLKGITVLSIYWEAIPNFRGIEVKSTFFKFCVRPMLPEAVATLASQVLEEGDTLVFS